MEMKTRIKMRQMPGDVSKQMKASMMEGTTARHYPAVNKQSGKKWKKELVLSRERAVLKERTRKEIKNSSE
jgi:hypothetical protein